MAQSPENKTTKFGVPKRQLVPVLAFAKLSANRLMMKTAALGKNRLIVFLLGLVLMAGGLMQLVLGRQSPNPAYYHWLEQKNRMGVSASTKDPLGNPPPQVIRQWVWLETGLAAVGLVSGVGLFVFSWRCPKMFGA